MSTRNVRQCPITRFLNDFFKTHSYFCNSRREDIFPRYRKFVKNPSSCIAALIQEPFKITTNIDFFGRFFGVGVRDGLEVLNRINHGDTSVLKNKELYQDMIILYLVNLEYLLSRYDSLSFKRKKQVKSKMSFARKALLSCNADDLVHSLEDSIFSVQYPGLYNKYLKLLDVHRDKYHSVERDARNALRILLKKNDIKASVQSRTKTVSSIHQKLKRKNVLFTQIMDIIGLRVLVKNKDDCYRVLKLVSEYWPAHHTRIKDYIAIPKENGYQSIHVTGEFDGKSVEIQIRTRKMHYIAQYGQAAHLTYKKSV